jgi:CRP/FNR family transcriptional regulator, cyclic AMP receptor protein
MADEPPVLRERTATYRRWPSSSLLGSLPDASRGKLLETGKLRQYPAGMTLVREGDSTTFVIVLLDGIVKVTSVTSDGHEALLAIRMGGDIIGELSALDGNPRSSTITTCGPVVGCLITQRDFHAILTRDSLLANALNRAVAGKLRAANASRVEFAGYDASTRLARVIRDLAYRYGERTSGTVAISWPLTQAELASLAGASEPTVAKALRRLRQQGIIATGYRSLTVLDLERLDLIAGK